MSFIVNIVIIIINIINIQYFLLCKDNTESTTIKTIIIAVPYSLHVLVVCVVLSKFLFLFVALGYMCDNSKRNRKFIDNHMPTQFACKIASFSSFAMLIAPIAS